MDKDYYEITSNIDAREILRYLNHLGITNITGEVLKQFITDLKKLIKYDLEQRKQSLNTKLELSGPERLHSASTFCSRIRSRAPNEPVLSCSRECNRNRKPLGERNIYSAPTISRHKPVLEEQPMRRACSCVRVERKPDLHSKESKVTTTTSSNNLIKVSKPPVMKKCDPVSLYHYYTGLWEKYKNNVPGQNKWGDLRWNVRQKMAGNMSNQLSRKGESHTCKGQKSGEKMTKDVP